MYFGVIVGAFIYIYIYITAAFIYTRSNNNYSTMLVF